jgi:hypothetical protein
MFSTQYFQIGPSLPTQTNHRISRNNIIKTKTTFSGDTKDSFSRAFQEETGDELPDHILNKVLTKPFFDSNISTAKKIVAVNSFFIQGEIETNQRDIHAAEEASGVSEHTLRGWGFRENKDDSKDRRTAEPVRRSSRHHN